jgi:hypothetical protein
LAKCQFRCRYWNYESDKPYDYECDTNGEENILPSGLCIFHDENYLKEDKENRKERERKVRDRLMDKISKAVVQKEALLCIGYYIPD